MTNREENGRKRTTDTAVKQAKPKQLRPVTSPALKDTDKPSGAKKSQPESAQQSDKASQKQNADTGAFKRAERGPATATEGAVETRSTAKREEIKKVKDEGQTAIHKENAG